MPMNLFPWRKKVISQQPVKEAVNVQLNKNNYKNFIVKAIGFIASQGSSRSVFVDPEYDLDEIRIASESDSYIKMALMKYRYLMYKAGYTLKSENDDAIEYIKMRFRIMSFSTSKPMDILFQEMADDLIQYSNAFLIKSRVDKLMPGLNAKGIFNEKPVGGYFRVCPTSIRIKRDTNGTVLSYEQRNDAGDIKLFKPTEMIHFYLDKSATNAFGTPRIIAAMEDVKLLRRIEGNIISLIYRFSIPIYQWMIGLPEPGFQATDKEIEEAQREIENMPMDGVIVTNEKTAIKAIGAEGVALDASKYLEYFEKRVFSALGVSESQMGRGGAKQDADSMEAQAHDTVKYIQRVISAFVENYMINELLLEGGFNPITNEDDIVTYVFDEISLETRVKVENHEMLKYQSNLNTFDEARRAIGKKPDTEEHRLYANMIDNKMALDQIDAKTQGALEIARVSAAAKGVAGNGATKSGTKSGSVSNNNRPTNQHGTTSVKMKESIDEVNESIDAEEKTTQKEKKHNNLYSSIYKKYENLRNDISDEKVDRDLVFPVAKDSIISEIKAQIQMKSFEGMDKAVTDLRDHTGAFHLIPNVNIVLEPFYEEVNETLITLLKDIKKRVGTSNDKVVIESVFNTLKYRLRFLIEFILPKVYWFSYVKTGAHYGIEKAYIKFNGSDDKEDHPSEINPKRFGVDEIPAYHSFCNCKVSFKAGDKV